MDRYGEILFIGKCNLKCFYCLGNEMKKLKATAEYMKQEHYLKWKGFNKFLSELKGNNVNKIYFSSTCTEPLLYEYIDELTDYLLSLGFKVGIRTNGVYAKQNIKTLLKLNSEISISINSLNKETNKMICGVSYELDLDYILKRFEEYGKKIRLAIVVNRYNKDEILDIIKTVSKYKSVEYVQLRKVYKYYKDDKFDIDMDKYDELIGELDLEFKENGNYYESKIYDVYGVNISLWNNVFMQSSVKSLNYFTDGRMSGDNLLVRIYEEKNERR